MYDSKTLFASVRAVAAACLLVAGAAQAAPVVSISPASQDLALLPVGTTATVDIVVSGLTQPDEAVGGFSLTLGYNDSLLAGVDVNLVPGGAFGAEPVDLSGTFSGGSIELFVVADVLADQAELAGFQGSSFVLATLTFEGISAGLSPLSLSNVVLSNWDGTADFDDVSSRNGQICVGGNCTVPEPASYALALAALGAAGLARRRPKVVKAI